jgi:predicted ribosomally synthesized peptide with nif11-like leader
VDCDRFQSSFHEDFDLMSVEDALAFLREARRDEALGQQLETLDGDATWEALVQIGARAGFRITSEDLQRAHALDWRMRWVRYNGST